MNYIFIYVLGILVDCIPSKTDFSKTHDLWLKTKGSCYAPVGMHFNRY